MSLNINTLRNISLNILNSLNDKQQNVIKKRFAIDAKEPLTLQEIGNEYGITRERVRQIQNEALNKLRRNSQVIEQIKNLHDELHEFLETHGGLKHEEKLLDSFLTAHLKIQKPKGLSGFIHLALHIGHPYFKNIKEDNEFFAHWYNLETAVKNARRLTEEMINRFNKIKTILHYYDVIEEARKIIKGLSEKAIISYLEISKQISSNTFGYWGLADWEEIRQRGVKGKIYVILEKERRPMHFREIYQIINKHYPKKVKIPTVHNELIKDDRFVLAGRGTYALRKWGYEDLPVKDVIIKIIRENKGKLSKEKLIQEVLKRKIVKPETVKLNIKMLKNIKEKGDLLSLIA